MANASPNCLHAIHHPVAPCNVRPGLALTRSNMYWSRTTSQGSPVTLSCLPSRTCAEDFSRQESELHPFSKNTSLLRSLLLFVSLATHDNIGRYLAISYKNSFPMLGHLCECVQYCVHLHTCVFVSAIVMRYESSRSIRLSMIMWPFVLVKSNTFNDTSVVRKMCDLLEKTQVRLH